MFTAQQPAREDAQGKVVSTSQPKYKRYWGELEDHYTGGRSAVANCTILISEGPVKTAIVPQRTVGAAKTAPWLKQITTAITCRAIIDAYPADLKHQLLSAKEYAS